MTPEPLTLASVDRIPTRIPGKPRLLKMITFKIIVKKTFRRVATGRPDRDFQPGAVTLFRGGSEISELRGWAGFLVSDTEGIVERNASLEDCRVPGPGSADWAVPG
jgi:hypothetical protein